MQGNDSASSWAAVQEHNRRAWNARVERRQRFTMPAADEEVAAPLATIDGAGWLADGVRGKRVLCLAAGGGRQGPLYAAAGGVVTVVDLSPEMLAIDREVARERGLELQTVETSMDDLSMFAPGSFEIVIQPVSTCYLPAVLPIYQAVARVTAPGGLYISQHKQPVSLQAGVRPATGGAYEIEQPYYRQGPLPSVAGSLHREEGTLEFLHRWEDLLGGMCRAGFWIEDLLEPNHAQPQADPGTFAHRSTFIPPYVRVKARRKSDRSDSGSTRLWVPAAE